MKGFATQKEVAEYLHMSVRYVQKITGVGERQLRPYRFGRAVRYNWRDVEAWAKKQTAKAGSIW